MYKAIVFIDHLNLDLAVDTVVAVAGREKNFKPKYIHWGKDTTSSMPDSLKVPVTSIIYPRWMEFRSTCSFETITTDTLYDMIFIMWGKVAVDSVTTKDTATALCLFGKEGLDTLGFIDLTLIDTILTAPYIAIKLKMLENFGNPKIRDFSYRPSYEFYDIIDTALIDNPIAEIPEEPKPYIKVYPNPAMYYTNVELNQIAPGNYILTLINLIGEEVGSQQAQVYSKTSIREVLDLQPVSSGVYYLRITTGNKLIGTYPVIISR